MPGFEGMNGQFVGGLQAFIRDAAEAGYQISLGSGYRSPERQAQLFANAVAKYGSEAAARKWVAPPGKSNHGKGIAADLTFGSDAARVWAHANAAKYGLTFPMDWEPWHIEPLGGARFADRDAYTTPPAGMTHPGDDLPDPHDIGTQMGNMLAMLSGGGEIMGSEMMESPEPTGAPTLDEETPDVADLAGINEVA